MFTEKDFNLVNNRYKLFYDKFKYKIVIDIPGIHFFRYVNTIEQFDKRINTIAFGLRFKNNFDYTIGEICEATLDSIKNIIIWKSKNKSTDTFLSRIEADILTVYANDISLIYELSTFIKNKNNIRKFKATDLNFDKGKIYLKNPKFKYRLFLNYKAWLKHERDNLTEFLNQDKENYAASKVLSDWLFKFDDYNRTIWSSNTFTIDMKEEIMITFFVIKFPNAIKKVVEIEKR